MRRGRNVTLNNIPRERITNPYFNHSFLNRAISNGDLPYVIRHLNGHVVNELIGEDETPLLIALSRGDKAMVDTILGFMSNDVTTLREYHFRGGWTPLGVVIGNDQLDIAKALVKKYPELPDIPISDDGTLPVTAAAQLSKKEIARFLFQNTSDQSLKHSDSYQASELLRLAIEHGMIDIALEILEKWYRLVVVKNQSKTGPMAVLASRSDLFQIPQNLGCFRAFVYSCIELDFPVSPGSTKRRTDQDTSKLLRFHPKVCKLIRTVFIPSFLVKELYLNKYMNWEARELLQSMIEQLVAMGREDQSQNGIGEAIFEAVRSDNRVFLEKLLKWNPKLLWNSDNRMKENMLGLAVAFQKADIFSLFYGMDSRRDLLLMRPDNEDEDGTILDIVARPPTEPYTYPMVTPLQLQQKLKWFKEVEALVPVSKRTRAWKKFQENYEPMRKEAETWMKGVANSCSVVAILIATITFRAVFTVPGSMKSESGQPLKLTDPSFLTFVISDVLAFFCSSTATFAFLGVLTERHLIEDFMRRLPMMMVIGKLTLILSVVLMILAFCSAIFTGIHYAVWVIACTVVVACVPVGLLLTLHYPHLRDMISSTFGKGPFNRDTKPWMVV